MKQSLQLKLGQQLTMTPQLQQAIRLLQLSTLDLQTEIQEALEANPMLDVAEDETTSDYAGDGPELDFVNGKELTSKGEEVPTNSREDSEDHTPDGEWSSEIPTELAVDTSWDDVYQSAPTGTGLSRPENDDMDFESRRGTSESLQDYLSWQLNLTPMSDLDRYVAEAIIDAVGSSGMLVQSVDDIWEGLTKDFPELEMDEVMAVLHRLQQFDPPGVVSQDLAECLLLQLRQLHKSLPSFDVAVNLVQLYLPLLGSRDFKQLMRKLRVKETELQEAIRIIQSLNPRPGERTDVQPERRLPAADGAARVRDRRDFRHRRGSRAQRHSRHHRAQDPGGIRRSGTPVPVRRRPRRASGWPGPLPSCRPREQWSPRRHSRR